MPVSAVLSRIEEDIGPTTSWNYKIMRVLKVGNPGRNAGLSYSTYYIFVSCVRFYANILIIFWSSPKFFFDLRIPSFVPTPRKSTCKLFSHLTSTANR